MVSVTVLFLISPLVALRFTQYNVPKTDDTDDVLSVKQHDTEKIMRKLSKDGKNTWVIFMGDSNMRNTYWWWVNNHLKSENATLLPTKHFTDPIKYNKKWSDQEAFVEYPDGFMVRASLRFLHGSEYEFHFKTREWHTAMRVAAYEAMDWNFQHAKLDPEEYEKASNDKVGDDADALQPSQFAKWAAKHKEKIDFEAEEPILAAKFREYSDKKPDEVILTEGWGGIPGCPRFDEVTKIFKNNPETHFVWSPIYFTNRQLKRHQCFQDKMQALEQQSELNEIPNFKYVDFWDKARNFGIQAHTVRNGDQTTHMQIGSSYMRQGIHRFEEAMIDGLKTVPKSWPLHTLYGNN